MKLGVVGVCKWGCGRPVVRPAIYWHRECFEEYALHTRLEHQYRFLVRRDGCACGDCGTPDPQKWGRSEIRSITADGILRFRPDSPDMIAWAETLWSSPEKPWAERSHEERHVGDQQDIYRTSALEVDHKIPLWSIAHLPDDERRWDFGPENLWLLCPVCHKAKSKREAAERAAAKRAA